MSKWKCTRCGKVNELPKGNYCTTCGKRRNGIRPLISSFGYKYRSSIGINIEYLYEISAKITVEITTEITIVAILFIIMLITIM